MATVELLRERVNADAPLVRRGRYVSLAFLLGIGAQDFIITINRGSVTSVLPRRLATDSGKFLVRAASETWREHWQAVPRRDFHDLWSMLPKSLATIDGDLLPFMQNLQYFKEVIAAPRDRRV